MSAALSHYAKTTGDAFPTVPQLQFDPDTGFWASAEMVEQELVITVTDGLVTTVSEFWAKAVTDTAVNLGGSADELTHLSLTWLMLHELHHYQMGHFALTGCLSLTEAKDGNAFGVASRARLVQPKALKGIKKKDLPKVEPCLELQADHDASEMLIDAYSPDGWEIIRMRVAAISAMTVMIESEDAKRDHKLSAHPKAATRIFQLLGHVIQMPVIEAMLADRHPELGIDPRIPSDAEQSAFNRKVVIPAFLDAQHLARVANAATIIQDLGTPQNFFRDVQIAKLADPSQFHGMTTIGAKQWAQLVMLNSSLLPKVEPATPA